jgi:hypothetical protein
MIDASLVARGPRLWTIWQPHAWLGLHIGTRMTIIMLGSGALVLHSPIAITPELRARVDALGDVRHIVCPNLYHHSYAQPWAEAYPRAMVHAPAGLQRKSPRLRIGTELGGPAHGDWNDELVPVHVDGCMLDETVFLHTPSRSLVSADLAENFSECDHWLTRNYLKAAGVYQRVGWSRPLRLLYRDRGRARRSIDRLLAFDAERVIIAHGDVIEGGVQAALRQTFEFLQA